MFCYQLKYKNDIIPNYMMNSKGEIYSYNSNKVLKPFPNKEGKLEVCVLINKKKSLLRLDYLMISTLKCFYDDIIHVLYIDNNFLNCTLDNLLIIRKSDIIEKYKSEYHVDDLSEISEEWKIYPDNPEIEVSNFGMVRYHSTHELLNIYDNHGYNYINISNNNRYYLFIHRLVAELFVDNPNPDKFTYVNHIDGNKKNNIFYNLEWCNISMNTEHAQLTGLVNKVDKKTVHKICELLEQGMPHIQIEMMTGINRKYISDIYRGRRWKTISSQYNIKRKIPLYELYNGEVVLSLLQTNHTPKEIAALLKIDYNNSFSSFCNRLSKKI